ncbi:hypothetical protein MMC25_006302 [Agyrium rufum]|nr:hypothetical protein [Agyrium rufum]
MVPRIAVRYCKLCVRVQQSSLQSCSYATASGSSTRAPARIPPESPRFIDVPQPPQQAARRKSQMKGILPVPRKIFDPEGPDKTSPNYLAAVTKEPQNPPRILGPEDPKFDLVQWKVRQAALRRKNLREGLVELARRKKKIDAQLGAQSARKQALYEEAVHRPEREDERLTMPSIPQNMRVGVFSNVTDPNRKKRIAEKIENTKRHLAQKAEDKRTSLHSLYMTARSFIVTEAALNAHVDQVFDDQFYKANPDRSIWDRGWGMPDTVEKMLNEQGGLSEKAIESNQGSSPIIAKRVKKITEELTGGKM